MSSVPQAAQRAVVALACAAGLGACVSAPAGSEARSAVDIPRAASASPSVTSLIGDPPAAGGLDVAHVLVWRREAEGVVATRWVAREGRGPRTMLTVPAPVVATPAGLHVVRATRTEFPLCACPGTAGPGDPGVSTALDLEPLGAGTRRALVEGASTESPCPGEIASFESSAAAEGVLGTLVTVRSSDTGMGCVAAHPFFGDSFRALDAATGQALVLAPPPSEAEALLDLARAQLAREYEGCLFDPEARPELYSTRFAFAPDGHLRASYGYMTGAPYACGTGPGHYSVLSEVISDVLPPQAAPWSHAPAWLVPELQGSEVVGVSPVPASIDVARLERALRSVAR